MTPTQNFSIAQPRPPKRTFDASRLGLYLFMIFCVLFFALPLYVILITSFKTMDEIRLGYIFNLPMNFTVEPWITAWTKACNGFDCTGLQSGFWNSVRILIPSLLMSLTLSSITGYALSLWRVRWGNALMTTLLLCAFIPFQIIMYPLIKITSFFGIYNTLFGVSVAHTIFSLPILTLIFRNFYAAFPEELMKAARIDSGGFFKIFVHIILPMSPNIMAVVLILQITGIWNDFLVGLTFGGVTALPMTVNLNNIVQTQMGVRPYNVYMSAALLTALPPMIVYFVSGRLFIKGITEGALKG